MHEAPPRGHETIFNNNSHHYQNFTVSRYQPLPLLPTLTEIKKIIRDAGDARIRKERKCFPQLLAEYYWLSLQNVISCITSFFSLLLSFFFISTVLFLLVFVSFHYILVSV